MIFSATLSGLLIGFGATAGLEPEAGEAVLFVVTMSASFFGFSSWLTERDRRDIRKADFRDYRIRPKRI